ncbi:MAG TPA: PQQ-binding-like beta-propeller repeat protein [Gemmataceae bacterium]
MNPRLRTRPYFVALGVLLLAAGLAGASDWSRFRGPNGTGIAEDKDVPVKWTADNVLWKTPIPGVGHSSPIVHGGRVFLQSSSNKGEERSLISLDAATGKILWKTSAVGHLAHIHRLNSLASSTPATDGARVYAVFWDGEHIHLNAYDFKNGKPVWEKDLGSFTSQHGVGHSPMLVDGKVILANDQDGSANLLAFDARSGEKAWEVERKAFRTCYSTPFIHTKAGGGEELIVGSTAGITGYNPADGKASWWYTWSFARMPLRTVASPILAGELIIANSGDGDGSRHLIAVKMGDKGDATATNLAWQKSRATPYVPCLLARGDHIYSITDKGMATCYVTRTGEEVWNERLTTGGFTASPVLVDGKIYAVANDGSVYVFEATPKFKLLAKNTVGESVSSTPAVADNHMFIRGGKHLFCIGKPAVKGAAKGR